MVFGINRGTYMGERGINVISAAGLEQFDRLHRRDAYYTIVEKIKNGKALGHAICIVGLRRTGKSILLNHLHRNASEFGMKKEEILHISLSAVIDGNEVTRDDFDNRKLLDMTDIRYPSLKEVEVFIEESIRQEKIRCILIDEITMCRDFILAGKGFIDSLVNSGMIVILAGTESVSFKLADENSLYTRLMLEDISYIPFGEYCRLKRLDVSTLDGKRCAIEQYIEHGNILDDTVNADDRYIESAIGVNVALSIMNADYAEFIDAESDLKEFVQSVMKYTKLIGETITINAIKSEISRADLSRALANENTRLKKSGGDQIEVAKSERTRIAIEGAERVFQEYGLSFGMSKIPLTREQLYKIDELFTKMGLIYNLSLIPEEEFSDGSVMAEDLTILHSILYVIAKGMANKIRTANIRISDEEAELLAVNIESAAKGRLLEGIIALEFLKGIEKEHELLTCLKNYGNGKFKTVRKCTKHRMYKYNNRIFDEAQAAIAEVDIVISEPDAIRLIEVKKSSAIDENQTRWLHNDTVVQEIRDRISKTKHIKKEVLYLGEEIISNGVHYRNIADVLLEHYDTYFRTCITTQN